MRMFFVFIYLKDTAQENHLSINQHTLIALYVCCTWQEQLLYFQLFFTITSFFLCCDPVVLLFCDINGLFLTFFVQLWTLDRLLSAVGVPWWCNFRLPHNKAPLWRSPAALPRRADRPALCTCQQHHICFPGCQVRLPQVLQSCLARTVPRDRWFCAISAGEERNARNGFGGELSSHRYLLKILGLGNERLIYAIVSIYMDNIS